MGFFLSVADADFDAWAEQNVRRKLAVVAPQGAAPLTAILSMLEDNEWTDGPDFGWAEERLKEKVAYLRGATGGTGPWLKADGTGGASLSFAANELARLYFSATESAYNFQPGERLIIHRQKNGSGNYVQLNVVVQDVNVPDPSGAPSNGWWTVTVLEAVVVANDAADVGSLIQSMGVPQQEGSHMPKANRPKWPIKVTNYAQIWRTPWEITANAVRQPMFFDPRGPYERMAIRAGLNHLTDIDNALMFGTRGEVIENHEDGSLTARRTTGGILYFLKEWEKANGGVFGYRPGGAAQTANTDDNKRILTGSNLGVITFAEWEAWEERMFRQYSTSSGEKLFLGGSAAIKAIVDYYTKNNRVHVNRDYIEGTRISFKVTTIETLYGVLNLKSHPRFNEENSLRGSGFLLDLNNIRFRPVIDRDTHVNEAIQENDFDGRKDEYFTDGGLELRFPETHGYFDNVRAIQTS